MREWGGGGDKNTSGQDITKQSRGKVQFTTIYKAMYISFFMGFFSLQLFSKKCEHNIHDNWVFHKGHLLLLF